MSETTNSAGLPPASNTPFETSSTSPRKWNVPGWPIPYALSTSTCGFARSSSVQFMPSRSASPWKLTSRRRWLRSRVRSIVTRTRLRSDLDRARSRQTSALRPVRAGGVLLQRREVLPPALEHRGDDTPGLLGLVAADRQGGVSGQHVEQDPGVGGQLGRLQVGAQHQWHETRLHAGACAGQLEAEALRLEPEAQNVGNRLLRPVERTMWHRSEAHDDLLPIRRQRLAGAQEEPRSRPAPVVELEHDLGERLRAALRRDSLLVGVAAIAGATRASRHIVGRERANGTEDVHLAVPQIAFPKTDRRLHRDQAEHLQEVVLHHVFERADLVVVAGTTFERERLVPDDLDLLDVCAAPDRLEHPVGQTRAEHVLDRGHGQEVIDAEHLVLAELLGEQAIEGPGAFEVLPERLLDHHLATRRKPRAVERRDRDREDRWRQRQVGGDGALAGDARLNAGRITEVDLSIARRVDERRPRSGVEVGGLLPQPAGRPVPEAVVVPVVPAGADQLEALRQVTTRLQGS